MKTNFFSHHRRLARPWSVMTVLVILTACAGGGTLSYTGQIAKPQSRVPLFPGDVRELRWQTNDLIIDADYVLEDGQLDLAGQVELQQRLAHFPVVDHLRINLHALDTSGVILASYPLWSAGAGNELFFIDWSFERHLAVPEGTQSLTFSYRGRMRDGGGRGVWGDRDDNGTRWDFWHTP